MCPLVASIANASPRFVPCTITLSALMLFEDEDGGGGDIVIVARLIPNPAS
jgi:hypothetical protein